MLADPAPAENGPGRSRAPLTALGLLIVFAATFPEVLSGSTPALVLLTHPLGYAMLAGLYGLGAVLVWEAIARWRKGWLAVLPLGAAYGIAEEGLGTKTFVDPHQQLAITGIPGAYGHWAGIEWVTFSAIDSYHAAISIGLQLLLVALLYPGLKGRSLVSDRGLALVGLGFAATVALMFFTVDPDPLGPLAPSLLLVSGLAAVLIGIGWRMPDGFLSRWMRTPRPSARPRAFFAVAFAWLLSLLVVYQIGSHLIPWSPVLVAYFLASGAGALGFLVTRSGWHDNRAAQVGFAGGLAGAFVVWDVFLELLGDVGVLAFTAVFVGVVVWLWRHPDGLLASDAARIDPQPL